MLKGIFRDIGKGVLVSVCFSLVSVLLFALVIKLFSLPSSVIFPVTQAVKALSILLACLFCVREEKGWLKGIFIGFFFMAITYLLFFLIAGKGNFSLFFLLELLFGTILGAISGILAVNIRK